MKGIAATFEYLLQLLDNCLFGHQRQETVRVRAMVNRGGQHPMHQPNSTRPTYTHHR